MIEQKLMWFGGVTKEENQEIPGEEWLTLGPFVSKQMWVLVMQTLIESWGFCVGIGIYSSATG